MTDKVDYLDEDPIISSQRYCVVSVLTPKNFKQSMEFEEKITDEVIPADEVNRDTVTAEEHNKVLKELASLKTQVARFKQEKELEQKKITMYTFKVRGSYESVDEAQKRIQLYKNNPDKYKTI